jgi:serine/threonine protein kinase
MKLSLLELQRLDELVGHGLSLEPAVRSQWLTTLHPISDALKQALNSALRTSGSPTALSQFDTLPAIDGSIEVASNLKPGGLIGGYKLIEPIGRGGSAVVWLAEKADGSIKRQVALKLPTFVGSVGGWAERVSIERDALAAMNHPHIATLYEAGVSSCGRPWLAIEYVKGIPFDAFIRGSIYNTRDLVQLFIQIAKAVEYSHSLGVIHRDIKPGNILISKTIHGVASPKLLDFGIAKLSNQMSVGSNLTQTFGHPFTPEYASPEQLNGQLITVATDIYALGALLYEVLAGRPMLKVDRTNLHALQLAKVQEKSLQNLGQKPQHHSLFGKVNEDLWAIVRSSLRTDIQFFYRSVNALADDLQRWLDGRPVAAHLDSTWYKTRRFIGRNIAASIATGAATVGLIFAAVFSVRQANEATEQRDAALAQYIRAEDALKVSEQAKKSTEEALSEAFYQSEIAREQFKRAESEALAASRAERVVKDALVRVAAEKKIAIEERAIAVSASAKAKSQSTRASLVKDFMTDLFSRAMLVQTIPANVGNTQKIIGLHDVLVEVSKAIESGFDKNNDKPIRNAVIGRLLEAEPAVKIEIMSILARMLSDLGLNLRAIELRKIAIGIRIEQIATITDTSQLAEAYDDIATREVQVAETLSTMRLWREADQYFIWASDKKFNVSADLNDRWKAYYLVRLGTHNFRQRKYVVAAQNANESIRILTALSGNSADLATAFALRANSHYFLGSSAAQVTPDLRLAVEVAEKRFGANHVFGVQYRLQLAEKLSVAMQQNEAIEQARRAWLTLSNLPDAPPIQIAMGAQVFARILNSDGQLPEVQKTLLIAKERLKGALILEPNRTLEYQIDTQLALSYLNSGDFLKARQLIEPFSKTFEDSLTSIADTDISFDTLYAMATVFGMSGQPARALKLFDYGLEASRRIGAHQLSGHQSNFARAVLVATLAGDPGRAQHYLSIVRSAYPTLDLTFGFARVAAEINASRLCIETRGSNCTKDLIAIRDLLLANKSYPETSVIGYLLSIYRELVRAAIRERDLALEQSTLDEFRRLSTQRYRPDSPAAANDRKLYADAMLILGNR